MSFAPQRVHEQALYKSGADVSPSCALEMDYEHLVTNKNVAFRVSLAKTSTSR